ncbi:MAG: RdgB/HAM1 family non-canonical purine NTP pyrophosphatase [Planctomycetota bacterium]|jgi:XTP/dITP diphosphohydrolase|nr:RdgB/HAM1 family non-canonical purine NTP pyrophosphatase [Planctomycetota bacterium]
MARTLVLATRNRKKLEEMIAILQGLPADLKALDDFGSVPAVPETGETFEENARAKALGYARATGRWALADDSGLEVDALGGLPGVRSSRWGGEEGNDRLNNETLLAALAGRPRNTWTARYRCVMALATPEEVLATTEGACEGRITDRPAGSNGFGYDPYFRLPERGCTMAELEPEVKNRLSHRYRALAAMRKLLEKIL